MHKHFGLCAIEYHEDRSVSYDYVVKCLINHELLFSIPSDFRITEIDLHEELSKTSEHYKNELLSRLPKSF